MLRWKCGRCNLTWIYPVNRCSHCKGPIGKDRTDKAKIIGITRVSIPSLMHPLVPYNVMLLEDEHGNRMPRKTMKDYRIGDEFVEEKAKTQGAVSIVRFKYDMDDAVEHALNLINFEVSVGQKILIKPSIIFAAYPYQAVNTNPKILESLIKFLLSRKIKPEDVTVAEQSPFGVDTGEAAAKAGILKVCSQYNVNVVDMAKKGFEERRADGAPFMVSSELAGKDVIINLPVMKTHSQWGVAGAMENIIRVADNSTQKRIHSNNPGEMLAKLNRTVKCITLGDATIGMKGSGPLIGGEPAFLNMVLASNDPVAIDRVFCEIGFFEVPEYINAAGKIGLGESDMDRIEVVGNEVDAVRYPLSPAGSDPSPHSGVRVIDGMAWSGDYVAMYGVLGRLANIQTKGVSVAIGGALDRKNLEGAKKIVALGDAAVERLKELGVKTLLGIKGSPPDMVESISLLNKVLESNGQKNVNIIDRVKSKIASRIAGMG
ncbi:DUF362 domain-containing protein [Candidatus Woesearchaeota archaeon]|nr:DUF362 domain-containing protein [Candidatus Woesearchaeota archaeon]